jgi:hypothetical protein
VSFDAALPYLLDFHDMRFAKHATFMFVAMDIKRRRKAALFSSITINHSAGKYEAAGDITASELQQACEELQQAHQEAAAGGHAKVFQQDDRMRELKRLVTTVSGKMPGSPEMKRKFRNQIWGMMGYYGAPMLYITVNPSACNSPICLRLCGVEISLDDFDADKGARRP